MPGTRFIFFVFFLFFFLQADAQNHDGVNPFRMNARLTATVPHPVSNKAFRRSFTGIYDVNLVFDYQVFHGFSVGGFYHNNLYKTPDNKIPGLNTYAQANGGGLRISYNYPGSETAVYYFGVSAGIEMTRFYNLSIKSGTDLSTLENKPHYSYGAIDAGAFFYTEGNFAIGVHAGYSLSNFHFDPYRIFLNQWKGYLASDLDGTVAHLDVGFCVVYSFLRKGPKQS